MVLAKHTTGAGVVTTLVVLVVVLLIAAGVVGYLVERARHEDFVTKPRRVIDLRFLPEERVRDYRGDWVAAQARFVDDPEGAARAADTLVERLMAERGYPAIDEAIDLDDLSKDQAEALQHYRAAHAIVGAVGGEIDTDSLRRAMVHYRMVFSSLLDGAAAQPQR